MNTQIYDFDNVLMQDDQCFSDDSYFYELEQSRKHSPRRPEQKPTNQNTITRPTETYEEWNERMWRENNAPGVM